MKLNIAYGLPGSGKTKLLISRTMLSGGKYVSFDEPASRKNINKFFNDLDYCDYSEYCVDFLIDDIHKLLSRLNEKGNNGVIVIIHRFIPNIEQCIHNDMRRGRDLSSIPTIKHMKIIELNSSMLNHTYTNLNIIVEEHNVYVGDNNE